MRHTFIMTESGETSFWSNHIQPHGFDQERTVEGVTFTNLRINGEWILGCFNSLRENLGS